MFTTTVHHCPMPTNTTLHYPTPAALSSTVPKVKFAILHSRLCNYMSTHLLSSVQMPKLMTFEEDGGNGCRVGKLGHSVLTFTCLLAGIFPDEAFLDEPCHKCRVCCTTLQSTGTCRMKLKLVLNNLR